MKSLQTSPQIDRYSFMFLISIRYWPYSQSQLEHLQAILTRLEEWSLLTQVFFIF
jgi:hypothetical protein